MPAADNHQPESSGLHKHKAAPSDTVCALATPSLGLAVKTLLTADLSPVQVPPWASTHAWSMNRARLRGTFLNKTRGDIRLCILFCVFPYRVWWFGICQVNRLRTDGERCETPLISEGLFQKHREQTHAGFWPLLLRPFCKRCPKCTLCW